MNSADKLMDPESRAVDNSPQTADARFRQSRRSRRMWGPVWAPETPANAIASDISVLEDASGVPERIRTSGPRIRNPVLYPAELRGPRQLRSLLLLIPCVIIRTQGIGHNGSMVRDI